MGWAYRIAVPHLAASTMFPDGWLRCLPMPPARTSKKAILSFLKLAFVSILPFYRFLTTNVDHKRTIIFIESINPFSLIAFTIAFTAIAKNNLAVWFLCRGEHSFSGFNKFRGLLEAGLQKIIKHLLPPGRFKLLSDTELFAKWYATYFRHPITVMPIPHTDIPTGQSDPPRQDTITCWMAGQQHAILYNVAIISKIAHTISENANKLLFVVSEKCDLEPVPGGVNLKKIGAVLTQEQYLSMFGKCDIVLLPYNPAIHSMRTSGVFVECIIAGRMPVVSKGTWMASELAGHHLTELAVDWHAPGLIDLLIDLHHNEPVRRKLREMRTAYLTFHNKTAYAHKLETILDQSFG
ncbi:hypothetical protein DSCOOX_00940 [Desulfosarcina ovata subsp. ovata]|uniref:Glycosyl transferase family 1 domain-containing protein n=2 Tax=Desulfosarcina ovata TaxID=83564 RepID=A0A5K8A3I6_9BACT|nr:hypothetical protein DSCOOX_00940 [Desulfosarcina ovata subsp. ovata]